MILNKTKFVSMFLFIILFLILEYFYSTFLIDMYAYRGFFLDFNLIRYIESKILFLVIISGVSIIKMEDFIYTVSCIFTLFFVMPTLIVYQFMPSIRLLPYSACLLIVMIVFVSFLVPNVKIPKIKLTYSFRLLIGLAIVLFIPFVLVYGFGSINLYNLLFQDVYTTRLSAVTRSNAYTSYMYLALAHYILPLILIISYRRKKIWGVFFSFIAIIYLFLTHSHKMTLLSLLLVVFFLFFKSNYVKKIAILLVTTISIIFFGYIFDLFLSYPVFKDIIIYRSLFVPSLLNVMYFDFFENNHIYWSDSFLNYIIPYSFDLIPPNRIGLEYLKSELNNAGNGLISDGYMNFNFVGVFFNLLLVSGYISFFKLCQISHEYFAILIIVVIALVGGSPFSFLLTGGGVILMTLFFFFLNRSDI